MYCETVVKALKRLPPDQVSVACYRQVVDLESRLRSNLGILQGAFAGGNLLSGFLKAVDRGINKIIGDEVPNSPQHQAIPGRQPPPPRSTSAPILNATEDTAATPQGESRNGNEQKETPNKSKKEGQGGMGLLARGLSFLQTKPKNQAKLGLEENKFFYDEKLKIWRVEGEEIPAEALPPAPPPTVIAMAEFVVVSWIVTNMIHTWLFSSVQCRSRSSLVVVGHWTP